VQGRLCVSTGDGSRYERRFDGDRLHGLLPPFLSARIVPNDRDDLLMADPTLELRSFTESLSVF